MGFWIFMTGMNLLIPAVMIGFGAYFKRISPKEINYIFGYRTDRSMKNKDTWEFAHKKLGKIWWSLGWLLLVITLLAMVLLLGKDKDTVGGIGSAICLLQLVPMLASIYPVEKALKETFDEKGMRR